jgi:sodium-dependent dicarboxylate transporter 2/3/5
MNRVAPWVVIGVLLALFLTGHSGLLDAIGIEAPAQVALVILITAAMLWITELLPLFVTSFLILALSLTWLQEALTEAGREVSDATFTSPFFSDIILLFLGGFVLSAALSKHGIDEVLARAVIRRTGGSIRRLVIGIMAITAFLSMWLSNTATASMMLSLCLPIVRQLDHDNRYRKAILLAVPFAANIGGLGTPIGSPPNAIAMQYLRPLDLAPSFVMWMALALPAVIVMLGVAWLVLMLVYRGREVEGGLQAEAVEMARTPEVKLTAVVALITIAGWLTTSLHHLSSGTVALLPVLVFFGLRILDVSDLRRLSWDVLLVMGGGLCLGQVIAVSGLADWLIAQLPVEGAGTSTILIAFSLVACFMSSVMSNTATANLVLPIVIGLAPSLGQEALAPLALAVAFACSLAMPLPISTPPNAIAFSSGEFRAVDLIRPGAIVTILGLVLTLVVGVRWWGLLGLY